jgi:large subunit ribosomal protein L9
MRVVFLEDVYGVAEGGDVKDVKNGFARNYLIPQKLALPATKDALARIGRLTKEAEDTRIKTLADMRELSVALNGSRVDVEMRAGASGRLYGSVTNAIVGERLSQMTDREIDRRTIELSEPIRELGSSEVRIRLHPEVDASITVLVHPLGSDADEFLATWLEEQATGDEGEGEQDGSDEVVDGAEGQPEEPTEEPAATVEPAAEEPDVTEDDDSSKSG